MTVISLTGFSPAGIDSEQLKKYLINSWVDHSPEDETHLQNFMGIIDHLAMSPEIGRKLEVYADKLGISAEQVPQLIFLLRRLAHADSFYSAIKKWEHLEDATRAKIIEHLGPTYLRVIENSPEQNAEIIAHLENKNEEGLPEEFRGVTDALVEDELHDYLEILRHTMTNTGHVMNLLDKASKFPELNSDL